MISWRTVQVPVAGLVCWWEIPSVLDHPRALVEIRSVHFVGDICRCEIRLAAGDGTLFWVPSVDLHERLLGTEA